ncbi:MAG: hypothetical protein E7523_06265 [Ruminococcaceae bacterium]|nr:hypothetical protein [Oscillospiraceae bacterium]
MEKLKKRYLHAHTLQKTTFRLPRTAKSALRYLACAGTGFLLSNACLIGNIRPLGISAAAALPTDCEIWAAFGASFGALLFCDVLGALKYISAVVLITLLRITVHAHFEKEDAGIFPSLAAAGSLCVCAAAIEFAKGITAAGLILSVCEGIFSGAGTFLLRNLLQAVQDGGHALLTRRTKILILLSCGTGILSVMQIRPFGFPVASVLAGLTVLIAAFCNKETGGCLAGVCCGCIAGLSDDGAYTVISCCMGGLLSGLCMPAGKFAAVLAYIVSCLLTMIANGVTGNPVLYALAAVTAGILFLLIPDRFLQKIRTRFGFSDHTLLADEMRAGFDKKLIQAEAAINSFAQIAAEVNERIACVKAPKEEEICHYVRSVCCADCPRQNLCWEHSLAGLRPVFLQARQRLIKDGQLTPATLPDRLTAACRKPDILLHTFNDAYARFLQRSAQNKEILAVKKLASTQLRTAADVLEDLRHTPDTKPAGIIRDSVRQLLKKADISVADIHAEFDTEKRIFIHIHFNALPSRSCLQLIENLLSDKLHQPFAKAVRCDEKGLVYCFYEQPAFSVQCENIQCIGGREQICGDSLACFRDAKGRFFAVLSDGMGTGERAALDSLMTTGLSQTLLKANLSVECTARLVNAALLLRSRQETVATLDVAVIDLYTGKVKIYKAGASFSVLQKRSETAVIEQQSLPLGILDEADPAYCEFEMHDGDTLFLMSDGACTIHPDFFRTLRNSTQDLSEAVEKIMEEALRCSTQGKADDITCLALRLTSTAKASPAQQKANRTPAMARQ